MTGPWISVEEALRRLARGGLVVVLDDEDRENEGDFVLAACHATPEAVNLMIREGGGLLCAPLTAQRARELDLPPMTVHNTSRYGTAFTVSVSARKGVSTGISAFDRATTLRALADPATRPEDLDRPGHVFPLVARDGGVLERPGHTEAAVELVQRAGLPPVAAICEVLAPDGRMARLADLTSLCSRLGLGMIRVADLVRWRLEHETVVEVVDETQLPARGVTWRLVAFRHRFTDRTHLALVLGEVAGAEPVLVRLHSQCLTGEAFGSQRCDCAAQLRESMERVARAGRGVVVYLRQEGRGIGLANKVRAYALQDAGYDTVDANLALGFPADARDHAVGAQIVRALGIQQARLLTNNPAKIRALERAGVEVVERIPLVVGVSPENLAYLRVKRDRLGHLLGELGGGDEGPDV
ncbi:MAG: GTP cyclohydrolase II [Armatimonadota bacterium]|nr:GTP cyclohydrolase II [Armatimonadota bacterium]MDR7397859.1 GTP cyclohydrolase II [Armatimonadota bacterium]MDR7476915.1 GTP cyclohydrolase II [Armatimonadota bacterium]MDR7541197.1 GTP cyclohydrolase II [Armatimonadota bacterium]MDR7579319.1 GTP cyclohydrolase II [Armatimonadota bacterium]